jgi:6-phosphogluconolactonase (cycloisomerase 2 family)
MAASARDPFFVKPAAGGRFLYLGTETSASATGNALKVLSVGPTGALTEVGSTPLDARSEAVVDPHGSFVWVATPSRPPRLSTYRTSLAGPLVGPLATVDWPRPAPIVHPSGRVLYTASATHVEAYAVDRNGVPHLAAQVPYPDADRWPLAIGPSGRFVYVVSATEVHAFVTTVAVVGSLGDDPETFLIDHGRVGPGGSQAVLTCM